MKCIRQKLLDKLLSTWVILGADGIFRRVAAHSARGVVASSGCHLGSLALAHTPRSFQLYRSILPSSREHFTEAERRVTAHLVGPNQVCGFELVSPQIFEMVQPVRDSRSADGRAPRHERRNAR